MPLDDWQFYVVSLAALWGLWALLRPFLPSKRRSAGCPTCASGAAAARPKRQQVTIEGK